MISLAENQTTNVVKVNLDKDKITTFAGIAGDYQGSLNVYDKYGKLLVSKTNSDTNAYTLSLNYSGEYYIAFNRSSSTAASTVNFGIKQIPQATASTPIPLALNTTTNVAISDMNQTASYQFTVADISYLDLTLNGYLMAEVYDSQQNLVQTLTSYTSKTLLAKGDYTLKVKPTYSYYYYYDHTITANLTAVQPLTQDAPVTIAADPKGGYRYLAINLEKGQRYAINYAVPNYNYYYGSGNVSLYDGSQLVQSGTISASSSQNMAFTAPHSGTFYVQVPANIGYTGIYSLVSGKETDLNYEVGTSYNGGNIAYQDQVNHHFEITKAGKYLLSDYADRNYNYLNLSLVDANGQVTNITNQTQLLDLAVGSYTLQVKKNANYNTGYGYGYGYGFTLKDVTTLDSLMLDTPTTTSTPDARSAVAWKISGTKGENVLIDARTPNTPYENWLLFNQNGQQVTNYNTYYNNDHSQKITLPEAGDYYLVSYGDYYRTKNRADYPAIRTVTISNFESHNQAITLNQQVTGQLPAGDTQNFTFSLDVEKNIGFAIRSGSYNIRLYGPNQQADVITLYPDDHNLQNYYLAPGDYRIEITGYGSTTPSYDFKLLDTAAQAQALSNNSGTLTATIPANQTQVSYALAVQAGQAYQLNFPNTNYYAATYKVVDEQGRTLVNNTNIGDYRNFTPSATGNVYLVVNKNQAIIAQDFNVNVLLTQSVATSVILTLGETASTSLHTAQDATKYQLHITNTGYYQFKESRASDTNMLLQFLLPNGSEALRFNNLSSLKDKYLYLTAGDYIINVSGTNPAGSDYQFQLVDATGLPIKAGNSLAAAMDLAIMASQNYPLTLAAQTTGYYRVMLTQNDVFNVTGNADLAIELQDKDGNILGSSTQNALSQPINQTGIYYLKVTNTAQASSQFQVSRQSTATVNSDVGETLATATELGLTPYQKIQVMGTIGDGDQANKDVDMYRFSAVAGDIIRFRPDRDPSSWYKLFDSTGNVIYQNSGYEYDYTIPSTGVYYFGVSGYYNNNYNPNDPTQNRVDSYMGNYQFTLERAQSNIINTPLQTISLSTIDASINNWQGQIDNNTSKSFNLTVDEDGLWYLDNKATDYYSNYNGCLLYTSPSPRDS